MGALDHGCLNVPLAKRGNIDRQLARYHDEQARQRKQQAAMYRAGERGRLSDIKACLAHLSDERVLELAKPLGKRTAAAARKALYQQASYNTAKWLDVLRTYCAALLNSRAEERGAAWCRHCEDHYKSPCRSNDCPLRQREA